MINPPMTSPSELALFLELPLPVSLVVQPSANILSASAGSPTVFATDTAHYFVVGDRVTISGTPGDPKYVGVHDVTAIPDATHFAIEIGGGASAIPMVATRTSPVGPLTIEEGKLRAGLDWSDGDPRDELMRDFITAARQQVEQDTGLAMLTQVRDIYWAPRAHVGGIMLFPPGQTYPLQAVLGDRPGATDGTTITRIVSGWTSIESLPPLMIQAVGLLVAHYATLGRDLATVDKASAVPMGYAEAIAPHVLVTQI
jgi:hypothetical protein